MKNKDKPRKTSARIKNKFRQSVKWKRHRAHIKSLWDGKDALTLMPLRKGWSCHHMDMRPENYELLSDERQVPLNSLSHRLLHFAYDQYKRDGDKFIERLVSLLDRMLCYEEGRK